MLDHNESNTLLETLQQLPLPIHQACRNGACGVCRCQLLKGEIDYGYRAPTALWQKHIDAGFILPCIAKVKTPLQLQAISLDQRKRRD